MSAENKNLNGRSFFSFLKPKEPELQLDGYRTGDIISMEPVFVKAGATLVGNIIAPQIIVDGLVYGSTAALSTIIHEQGQVWGDIYTGRLRIENGGKIQGWVSSLDESGFQTIQNEGTVPKGDPTPGPFDLPDENLALVRSETQMDVLRRLQSESAVALAARAELDHTFESRLQEATEETAAKVDQLDEALKLAQAEIVTLQQEIEQTQETLGTRTTKIERQSQELATLRNLLAERNEELTDLQQTHQQQSAEYVQLKTNKTEHELGLRTAQDEVDQLTKRIRSLETALQANLQHSAEQEDALARWQELADVNEFRISELERDDLVLKQQLEESNQMNELQRQQRSQIEKDFKQVLNELAEFQAAEAEAALAPELQNRIDELEAELAQKVELEKVIQTQVTKLEARTVEIESLRAKLESLRARLIESEETTQDHQEQLLWFTANLKTSRSELEQVRQTLVERDDRLQDLHTRWTEQQTAGQQVDKLGQTLQAREQALETTVTKLDELRQQAKQERDELREQLLLSQSEVDTLEAEIQQYQREFQSQGQRLAEIQSTLIERDLELEAAQNQLAKRAQTIQQIKQLAGDRIKSLQTELAANKRQLAAATAMVERHHKKL